MAVRERKSFGTISHALLLHLFFPFQFPSPNCHYLPQFLARSLKGLGWPSRIGVDRRSPLRPDIYRHIPCSAPLRSTLMDSNNCSTRCNTKHHRFSGSDMMGGSSSSSSPSSCGSDSNQQKRQRNSPASDEYGDNEQASLEIMAKSTSDYKNKKPIVYDSEWKKEIQVAFPEVLMGSITDNVVESDAFEEAEKCSQPDAADFNSNLSDLYDDFYEDDDDDYEYDEDIIDNDCSYGLAAKFDDLDLPPGVEATVPWLQKAAPERPRSDKDIVLEGDIDVKFKSFKQFDYVEDYSDHFYAKDSKDVKKPPKDWMKKIQHEWKLLENDLPETIFVRVYEERMDLLRAVIIGPVGTPYHDGLFFFDFQFPSSYPHVPPKAHYHSGGLRLNPNLYVCGKVCLSLLGTWSGKGCEKWDPNKSTMLQVLVSIQALVLNEKPYFNEPGYEMTANTNHGEQNALAYNETTFLYSCKTMMYSLRKSPKCFEDFVAGHFRKRGHHILVACRAYLDSAQVGSAVEEYKGQQNSGGSSTGCSQDFKRQLKQLFEDLLMEFTVKGADCKEFLNQKVKVGDATALPKEEEN